VKKAGWRRNQRYAVKNPRFIERTARQGGICVKSIEQKGHYVKPDVRLFVP
jgi:hypothetical protein